MLGPHVAVDLALGALCASCSLITRSIHLHLPWIYQYLPWQFYQHPPLLLINSSCQKYRKRHHTCIVMIVLPTRLPPTPKIVCHKNSKFDHNRAFQQCLSMAKNHVAHCFRPILRGLIDLSFQKLREWHPTLLYCLKNKKLQIWPQPRGLKMANYGQ